MCVLFVWQVCFTRSIIKSRENGCKKKKKNLKITDLRTYISDILLELDILLRKLFFLFFIILKEGDLVFRAVCFLWQGAVVVGKFLKEGIFHSDNELFCNGRPFGNVFNGLITSLWMTRTLKG